MDYLLNFVVVVVVVVVVVDTMKNVCQVKDVYSAYSGIHCVGYSQCYNGINCLYTVGQFGDI